MLWWAQAIKPSNPQDDAKILFSIEKGETARSIASRLQKQGLLRSPVAFFMLARFGKLDNQLQAGDFRLSPSMNLFEVAESLTHGTQDIWLVIPEGWRNEEIALKITQEMSIPEAEFLKYSRQGYMFPDTYLLPSEADASVIAKAFLDNFEKKVTPDIIQKAQDKGLSLDEVITIASMVEREAKFDQDRPLVASVILNRLKIGMKLDIDATVQYALGYQSDQKSWWKKNLTYEDLQIDSPFNTYKFSAFPPSPICNPGLATIMAVIQAPDSEYLYYLSEPDGTTHFSANYEEHNSNIEKYLN